MSKKVGPQYVKLYVWDHPKQSPFLFRDCYGEERRETVLSEPSLVGALPLFDDFVKTWGHTGKRTAGDFHLRFLPFNDASIALHTRHEAIAFSTDLE